MPWLPWITAGGLLLGSLAAWMWSRSAGDTPRMVVIGILVTLSLSVARLIPAPGSFLHVVLTELALLGMGLGLILVLSPCGRMLRAWWGRWRLARGVENQASTPSQVLTDDDPAMELLSQRLYAAERRFDDLTNLSPVGLYRTDENGDCVFVNDPWSELVGMPLEEALGEGWKAAIHPEDAPRVFEEWQAAISRKERFQSEYRMLHRTGRTVIVLGSAVPIRDVSGSVEGYVGTVTDVTDSRQIEQALRKSEETYRTLIETTDTGYVVIDSAGQVLDGNANYVRMIGRGSLDDILGKSVIEWTWPDDRDQNKIEVQGCLTRGYVRNLQMRYCTPEMVAVPIEINAAVVHDDAGPRILALCRDVSSRFKIDAQLREAADQLQVLSRRLIEVQEAERRHLARELHDEIGQLLTAISIATKSAHHGVGTDRDESLQSAIDMIDAAIQQVRNLSLDLRPSMLDDLGLVPAIRWYAERLARQTHWQLDLDFRLGEDRLPSEHETCCFRIIQESLTNAARHAQARRIEIALVRDAETVFVQVRDDGSGFDSCRLPNREEESAGLLGMRERVHLLRGKLSIDSMPGQGTTIAASFPLAVTGLSDDDTAG